MSQEDIERIKALLLEQQAERLRNDACLRMAIRHLRERELLPKVPVQPEGAKLEESFLALNMAGLHAELNGMLAKLADENPARASALTKLLLRQGLLTQGNDDLTLNS